jgi:hypothetical protein
VSLAQAAADGNEVYLLEYDLERDPEVQGRAPLEFLRTLLEAGRIVDCMVDLSAADGIPFHVVFATLLAPRFAMAVAKLPQDRVRQLTPDEAAEPVPLPTSFQEEFGAAVLTVADGAGRIASPKHLEGHSLDNVHVALLAGMTRCSRLVVDFGGIEQCDVFFFQLLCAAQHAYNARGLRLSTEGALEPDLSKAATTMGFGCNGTPGCLFNAS